MSSAALILTESFLSLLIAGRRLYILELRRYVYMRATIKLNNPPRHYHVYIYAVIFSIPLMRALYDFAKIRDRSSRPHTHTHYERRALTFLILVLASMSAHIAVGRLYLRLKQIKRYQAFRPDDKEHRGDAEAFGIPRGRRHRGMPACLPVWACVLCSLSVYRYIHSIYTTHVYI